MNNVGLWDSNSGRFRDVALSSVCLSQEELGGQLVWQRPPAACHNLPTTIGQLDVLVSFAADQ